jgi:hypothetical protein
MIARYAQLLTHGSYVKQQKFSTKFGSNATPLENREKFGQAEA